MEFWGFDRKITAELKEEGHPCGRHKVARFLKDAAVFFAKESK